MSGLIDETTVVDFAEILGRHAENCGGTMVVDLSGIASMSSRGLRALSLAQRRGAKAGTQIRLARPNPALREQLSISRYDILFPVAETIEDALKLGDN